MYEIKNKIITISGEPVSGKSTVVKYLKSEYEKKGYNVHIISVGNTFRELIKREYLKMYPDRKEANLADIQTDKTFIKKRNMIDKMVDGEIVKKGLEINNIERPNDVYIIDSRLAWNNIPDSYSVRLVVNEKLAGKRVFNDTTRGIEDQYETIEKAIEKTRERKLSEIQRYKERYGVDLANPDNYDLIIDTSYSNSQELAEIIINGEEKYRNGEEFPKTWKSPALFLLSRKIGETTVKSSLGFTIEEIAKQIKENGYNPNIGEITAMQKGKTTILKDGHHRSMAVLASGKTLIPYHIQNKDDEVVDKYIEGEVNLEKIYNWEECIRYYAERGNIESLKKFNINEVIDLNELLNVKKEEPNISDDGR